MATGTLRVDRFVQQDPSSSSQPPNSTVLFPSSSLNAPDRSQSIIIDDYNNTTQPNLKPLPLPPNSPDHPSSSSDSDDDENENPPAISDLQSRYKRLDQIFQNRPARKTSSSLSLETLQNDSDAAESAYIHPRSSSKHPRPDLQAAPSKRRKLTGDAASPNRNALSSSFTNHNVTSLLSNGTFPVSRAGGHVGGACAKCGIPSLANSWNPQKICSCSSAARGNPNDRNPSMDATKEADVVATEEGRLGKTGTPRYLVNIAPLAENDGTGWDRFIFFSHRSQRFHFESEMYLSTFSPFAAVASGMEGVTSTSVCAVCGAGGNLTACSRCPLAFHMNCIDPTMRGVQRTATSPWFCNACKAVKRHDTSCLWRPALLPPPLPSPETGFARLIADAKDGNPIDMVFNPTLFNFYRSQCGTDWLRCRKCGQIRIAGEGVLTESVHIPFDCSYAFWAPEGARNCSPVPLTQAQKSDAVKAVEQYRRNRSRRRNALFFYGFGEENRTDYGFPPLNVDNDPPQEVIIIEDEEAEAAETLVGANAKEDQLVKHNTSDSNNPFVTSGTTQAQLPANHGSVVKLQVNPAPPVENKQKEASTGPTKDIAVPSAAELRPRVSMPQGAVEPNISPFGKSSPAKHTLQHESSISVRKAPPRELETENCVSREPAPFPENAIELVSTVPSTAAIAQDKATGDPQAEDRVGTSPTSSAKDEPKAEVKHEEETLQGGCSSFQDPSKNLLSYIASLHLDDDVEDCLTDMALKGNKALNQLYLAFRHSDAKFKRHATRFANRAMGNDVSGVRF